jgi:hypothetical protein
MPASEDPSILIHDHPRKEGEWADTVSPTTLAALIDKLGEGQRLYFRCLKTEWYVLPLKPNMVRLGKVDGGVTDFRGHDIKSRGTLVADEMRGAHALRERAKDFKLVDFHWVKETVYPHPTGCMLCNDCDGTGERVLFQQRQRNGDRAWEDATSGKREG